VSEYSEITAFNRLSACASAFLLLTGTPWVNDASPAKAADSTSISAALIFSRTLFERAAGNAVSACLQGGPKSAKRHRQLLTPLVEPFGIRVRIVLPGSSGETRLRDTARTRLRGMDDEAYGEFMRKAIVHMSESTGTGTRMRDVAEAVWRAATDGSTPLYIPAGADAVQWAAEAG